MKFGVIIVTYNRLELLKECVSCVLDQSVMFTEVCIVDNHSTDGTKEYLDDLSKSRKSPLVSVHHLPENMGGAGGFSYGMEHIDPCDWVLIIDDDAMLEKNYIENLKAYIDTTKYLAFSGSVYTDGKPDILHRRRIRNRYIMSYEPVPEYEYDAKAFEYDVSTFCGLLINYELMRKAGLPKKEYFIWFDDTEYCLRIGMYTRILNVNAAVLDHKTVISKEPSAVCWKNYYGFRNAVDIGKQYAVNRYVYILYIYINYMTHIILDVLGMSFGSKDRDMRSYRINVYKDALCDSLKNKLGRNGKYLPG